MSFMPPPYLYCHIQQEVLKIPDSSGLPSQGMSGDSSTRECDQSTMFGIWVVSPSKGP